MYKANFEDWLKWAFAHPIMNPPWYLEDDVEQLEITEEQIVEYLTRLFLNPGKSLSGYTDEQIAQGLTFLISSSGANFWIVLASPGVAWEQKRRCVRSMETLFEYFSRKCTSHLSHGEPAKNPIDTICYMWWDEITILPGLPEKWWHIKNPQNLLRECIVVMESALQLDSLACQESALHGLGHWKNDFANQVYKIIDKFLKKDEEITQCRQEREMCSRLKVSSGR